MRIRPVELQDAAKTVAILNAIIATGDDTSMSELLMLADQQKYIEAFPKRGVFLVAELESDGAVIGMQSFEPLGNKSDANGHVGEISTFVAAPHRGHGVGSRLTEHLASEAMRKGCRKLVATMRADNQAAQGFYARVGFRTVGVLKSHLYYRGRFIDQVIAERVLVDGDA